MKAMEVALILIAQRVIEVRPDGTVWKLRNLNTTPLLAPRRMETRAKMGYSLVRVWINNKGYLLTAHQLVWTVLKGPIPLGLEPNHKDGNKSNNHPNNLELMTRGKNIEHAWRTGLRKRSEMPKQFQSEAKLLRAQGLPYAEIGARLGISQTTAFKATRVK